MRLALRMRRDRTERPIPAPTLRASVGGLVLEFSPGWLDKNPLTRADLVREARHLESLGLTLEITETP